MDNWTELYSLRQNQLYHDQHFQFPYSSVEENVQFL